MRWPTVLIRRVTVQWWRLERRALTKLVLMLVHGRSKCYANLVI